jgi:hypothetical protein
MRCLFDPWIRDGKNQDPDPVSGSGLNNPDHISESLETVFWVKILKFFDADPGGKIRIQDRGWKKFGSGINIPDPQRSFKHHVDLSLYLAMPALQARLCSSTSCGEKSLKSALWNRNYFIQFRFLFRL